MGVYTNTMRYTGTSGVDVESMVQALMKAEGTKADRLYREKQKLEWTQEMFRQTGTAVKTFSNNYLSFSSTSSIVNMRSSAAYSNKTLSGSFSGGQSITSGSGKNSLNLGANSTISTTSNAVAGDYEIDIKSVATADTYTSNKMSSDVVSGDDISDIISDTLNDPKKGIQAGDYLDVTLNGSTKRLVMNDDDITRIKNATDEKKGGDISKGSDELAKILQEKINTQFGTIGEKGKVDVSITDGGKLKFDPKEEIGVTFSISAPKTAVGAVPTSFGGAFPDYIFEDGKFVTTATDNYKFSYAGGEASIDVSFKPGDDKQSYVKSINESIAKDSKLKGNISAALDDKGNVVFKKTSNIPDINVELVRDEPGYPLDRLGTIVLTSNDSLFNSFNFSTTASSSTFNVNQKINNADYEGVSSIKFADGSKVDIKIGAETTYKDVMDQVNASGKASLTFNANTNSFTLKSKKLGENGAIAELPSVLSNAMQLGTPDSANHTKATNAEVNVKGPNGINQTLVRESNTFSYAEINFKLDPNLQSKINSSTDKDVDGKNILKIQMSVTENTDQAYDNIKGFVDAYNTLIEQLSAATNTPRAKSGDYSYYQPLTDEEKEGMSDEQIKKLEDKAKQGLLNRNPELTRLQDKLREITTTQVTLQDGTKMSLASIGITTGDYSQGGKLFIDEDKLRGALEKNSDGVAKLFTDSKNGVAEKIYNSINDAVGSNGYITKKVGFTDSIYVKNNYYSKQIEQKSKELERVNDYLIGKENYYYRMFANMEKVISESNNQMASLMNY